MSAGAASPATGDSTAAADSATASRTISGQLTDIPDTVK